MRMFRTVLLSLCLLGPALANPVAPAQPYKNYRVFEVVPDNEEKVRLMQDLDRSNPDDTLLEFWSLPVRANEPLKLSLHPDILEPVEELLRSKDVSHKVIAEDLQTLIDEEMTAIEAKNLEEDEYEGLTFRDPGASNYDPGNYNSLEKINSELEYLERLYDDMQLTSIGTTSEGRDILMAVIGSFDKPVFLMDCGIHAREWISPSFCMHAIDQLLNGDGRSLLSRMQFQIIPVMNPDGYVYSWDSKRLWRKNRNTESNLGSAPSNVISVEVEKANTRQFWPGSAPGQSFPGIFGGISNHPGQSQGSSGCSGVDPNRNFATKLYGQVGSSSSSCKETYHGPHAFSEAESQALKTVVEDLLRINRPILSYTSVHAYSQYWMSPYGYDKRHPVDYDDHMRVMKVAVDALAEPYGTRYTYGPIAEVIYKAAGSSVDWAYDQGIKYSFALELRDSGRYGFLLPVSQIRPTNEETWKGLHAAAMEMAKEF